jgi:hypothetical protein
MNEDLLMPELKDVIEMTHRFNASHPEGIFMFAFVGFKKEKDLDDTYWIDDIDDNKTVFSGYGNLEKMRIISNDLRSLIEDNVNENNLVNF